MEPNYLGLFLYNYSAVADRGYSLSRRVVAVAVVVTSLSLRAGREEACIHHAPYLSAS